MHRNPTKETPRYLVTNLARETFSVEHISDAYRLRWQIELLFKEWKSHANLHICTSQSKHRRRTHLGGAVCRNPQTVLRSRDTTRRDFDPNCWLSVLVLHDLLHALMHRPNHIRTSLIQTINYLARNARRAHPARDRHKGRLKLGLEHIYGTA